ncbi:MAG: CaiB/BaiF CoA-transferase family protein [Pseudomonadota bacterium]
MTKPGDQAGPLAGMKVLELSHVMAGPTCGRLLADLGADVIKLERPGGEDSRRMAPPWQGDEAAGYLMLNRNKRGICVDLKKPGGLKVLLDLAARSDVLLENFRKGTLDRLGCGYEELRKTNPGLIYCEISGFGRTGPYANRGGFDLVAQAMSGILSVTGEGPGRPPVKAGVPVGDVGAGMLAAIGILAAHAERQATGLGQRVDTSLLEGCLSFMAWPAATFFANGMDTVPMGTAHPLDAPYQAFESSDGWLIVGAANQANWLRLLDVIGRQELAEDPRFIDNPDRVENLQALIEVLEPVFKERGTADWVARLDAGGVPCGPINRTSDMLQDPHVAARQMICDVEHPVLGNVKTMGSPIKFSNHDDPALTAAPLLGEHTREVLAELDYSAETIDGLLRDEAIFATDTTDPVVTLAQSN